MKPIIGMLVLIIFITLATIIHTNKHIKEYLKDLPHAHKFDHYGEYEYSAHASLTAINEASANDPAALRSKTIISERGEEEKEEGGEGEEEDNDDGEDNDNDDDKDSGDNAEEEAAVDVKEKKTQLDPHLVPTVIIAGAQKGGTDALRYFLDTHPQMKGSIKKETHFFDIFCGPKKLESKDAIERTRVEYASSWKKDAEGEQPKFTFEKTPKYLFDPYVPEKIKTLVPWTKIVMTLREPVERAYSQFKMQHYLFQLHRNEIKYGKVTFETCIDIDIQKLSGAGIIHDDTFWEVDDEEREKRWLKYWSIFKNAKLTKQGICVGEVGRGLYSMQLRRWFKAYNTTEDREKIFITKSESLLPDKKTHAINLKPITDFIGIDEMKIISKSKIHATSDRHVGPMKDETRQNLIKIFEPFNKDLERLLGDEWRDPWPYSR